MDIEEHRETWCGWCGRWKLCKEYKINNDHYGTVCKDCEECSMGAK